METVVYVKVGDHFPQVGEFHLIDGKWYRIVERSPYEEDATGLGAGIWSARLVLSEPGITADPDAPHPEVDPWDELGLAR